MIKMSVNLMKVTGSTSQAEVKRLSQGQGRATVVGVGATTCSFAGAVSNSWAKILSNNNIFHCQEPKMVGPTAQQLGKRCTISQDVKASEHDWFYLPFACPL